MRMRHFSDRTPSEFSLFSLDPVHSGSFSLLHRFSIPISDVLHLWG
ncbi:MAG: hypothetical protein QNJ72_23865 [Pleurocapsa sp. MO_226.B13]|nr:hypothetical protein [Pleurocapsa sp. MO_226.B13]